MATSNLRFRIIGEDDASSAFLKVAAAARLTKGTFDDLGSSALGLTKMVGGAGLIPVAAGATAVMTELSVAAGAAAGAFGVFGLSAGGFLKQMATQQQKITTTRTSLDGLTKGTQAYHDALVKLHNQQAAFNQQFGVAAKGYDNMHSAFQRFLDATGPVTKGVLAKGFNLIASVLPKLVPVSNAAGKAVGGLLDDLRKWTKGPEFGAVIQWFKTSGPAAITHFGHAVGNIIGGLGGILKNFVGPGDKAAASLEDLTKRFKDWANSKGVSDSVNKFLDYVSNNGDKIVSVFKSLADAAPKLASAFGGLGSANLTALSMFLNLIAGLPQGAFNVIVDGMFGIVAASKALSIVTGLTAIFTGLSTALTAVKDACILTRIQLGLLFVQEKLAAAGAKIMAAMQAILNAVMDANPIALVILALVALGIGLVIAYKKSATFRAIVQGAWAGVKDGAQVMWGVVKTVFSALVSGLKTVGGWAKWLWNNAFQPALRFIVSGIAFLLGVWAKMLSALGHVPGFGWAKDAAKAMQSAADTARNLASNIKDIPTRKESTVVLNVVHNVVHTTGGHVPAFAKGGVSSGGAALVGEEGPELVTLPAGARVHTAGATRRLMRGGGDTYIVVNAGGLIDPDKAAELIERGLLKRKRIQGRLAFQS